MNNWLKNPAEIAPTAVLIQKSQKIFWVGGWGMGRSGYMKRQYFFVPPNLITRPWSDKCFVFRLGRALGLGRQNRFIRITPAVTDCHYALPDRWSCGEKGDRWWNNHGFQRTLLLQPVWTNAHWVSCMYKGVRPWLWLSFTAQRDGGRARLGTEYPLNLFWVGDTYDFLYRRTVVTGTNFLGSCRTLAQRNGAPGQSWIGILRRIAPCSARGGTTFPICVNMCVREFSEKGAFFKARLRSEQIREKGIFFAWFR